MTFIRRQSRQHSNSYDLHMSFEIRRTLRLYHIHSLVRSQRQAVTMRQHIWTLALFLVIVCNFAQCRTIVKRQANGFNLNAAHTPHEVPETHGYRDKAKVEAFYGVKNAILGFVFNKRAVGFAWEKPTTPKGPTTTEDIVIFEKDQKVSLELPGELFGSSFTLVTNLSNTVGDFMTNSAFRLHRLLKSMSPFLKAMFGSNAIVLEAVDEKPKDS